MNITRITVSALLLAAPFAIADEKAQAPAEKPAAIPEGLVPLAPQETTHFAFLCLNDKTMADAAEIKKALIRWFDLKDESEIIRFKQDKDKGTLSWTIGKARFVAALAEYSIPQPDLQYASNNSLHWPEAEEVLLKQQAHYTVTCTSIYPQKWMTSMALTKAIAALAETHKTAGMYWGDASIVHNPQSFIKLAKRKLSPDSTEIPADLWVGILLEKHKDGTTSAYTDGLRVLGYREMEIHKAKQQPSTVVGILHALSKEVLNKRLTIQDKQKVSTEDGRSYQTAYGKSAIERKPKVIVISP